MTPALYVTYSVATLIFCLTPGPAVLLTTSQAMAGGFRAGVLATLGIQFANLLYWIVFLAGLDAVMAASKDLFTIIKYAGAIYLVVLGVLTFVRAKAAAEAYRPDEAQQAKAKSLWRSPFLQGVVNQIANPKAMLFMAVFVPQFVTPGKTTIWDFVAMAGIGFVCDFASMLGYAWLAARGGAMIRKPSQILWRERAAGLAQIAVGGIIGTLKHV
jgi:homoserine/homoserine lactone efflux protein